MVQSWKTVLHPKIGQSVVCLHQGRGLTSYRRTVLAPCSATASKIRVASSLQLANTRLEWRSPSAALWRRPSHMHLPTSTPPPCHCRVSMSPSSISPAKPPCYPRKPSQLMISSSPRQHVDLSAVPPSNKLTALEHEQCTV